MYYTTILNFTRRIEPVNAIMGLMMMEEIS